MVLRDRSRQLSVDVHDESLTGQSIPLSNGFKQGRASVLSEPLPMGVPAAADGLWRKTLVGMGLTDALCVVVALGIAYLIRFGPRATVPGYFVLLALAPVLWILVFHAHSLYSPHDLSPVEEFRRVISAVSIGVVVLILTSFWTYSSFSRIWIALSWLLSLGLELVARRFWRGRIARLCRSGQLLRRTLVVGNDREIESLRTALGEPESGFAVVGSLETNGEVDDINLDADRQAEIRNRFRDLQVECVFINPRNLDSVTLNSINQIARQEGAQVKILTGLPDILASRLTVQPVGRTTALSMRPVRLTGYQTTLKRSFDVLVGLVLAVLSLPLWLAVAAAIAITSRGPVLFRQERITKGGAPFTMYKFRTMRTGPTNSSEDPSRPFFKLDQSDPRFTAVGRVIRRFSIDELPQLLNVLKGDMSLVGPRPLPADQVLANLDLLDARHEVPAGVTGYWQIKGRSDLSSDDALRLDQFYIENWSLSLDLYILLKTVGTVLLGRGAY